jgi:hypothetical protein
MRRNHGSLASLLILAAACGGGGSDPDASGLIDSGGGTPDATENPDAPGTPDAMLPDAFVANLDCLGDPLPGDGEADDPVTISGDVFDPGIPGLTDPEQLAGITLDSFAYGDESSKLDTDTSAATTGAFSLTAATGNNPLNAYIRAQQQPVDEVNNTYITTYVYPGVPQTTSQTGIRIPMISESTFTLLQNFSGLSQTADQGIITVIVVDCDGTPLPGATVSSNPAAGTVAYLSGTGLSTTGSTDSSGLAFLIDVPIPAPDTTAEVEVSAVYDSMNLRAHTVTVREFVNPDDDTPSMNDERRMVTTQVVP